MISPHYHYSPFLFFFFIFFFLIPLIISFDPDATQDFCIAAPNSIPNFDGYFPCKPSSSVTSSDFFSTILASDLTFTDSFSANASFADVLSFPALNTLGITMVRVVFAPGGLVQPHTHPRATEIVFVAEGRLLVGFVATDGRYFSKIVGSGGLFVIPLGLMHFQYNVGRVRASAIVAFNSQLPGTQAVVRSLFGSNSAVPDAVLTQAFGVGEEVVAEIRAKFG